MSWEDSRSVRKEPTSMECSCRKEWSVGGGSGAGFIHSLVKTGKWSDGDQWAQETAGASDVSEEVMTRSRMWFLSCVGKWTCWLRLKEDRRDRNWEVRVSAGLSRWMLKSPVMINSWGVTRHNSIAFQNRISDCRAHEWASFSHHYQYFFHLVLINYN